MSHNPHTFPGSAANQIPPPPPPPPPPPRPQAATTLPQGFVPYQAQAPAAYAYNNNYHYANQQYQPPPPPPAYNYNNNNYPTTNSNNNNFASHHHHQQHQQGVPYPHNNNNHHGNSNNSHHHHHQNQQQQPHGRTQNSWNRKRKRINDPISSLFPPPPKVQHQEPQEQSVASSPSWTCDTCHITVDSERAYQAHVASHIKCSACDFQGAPKVVKAHYQSVHGKFSQGGFKTVTVTIPGCRVQRFRICVGNRPEDVQQWIAERKKRFPRKQPPPPDAESSGVSQKADTAAATGQKIKEDQNKAGLSSLLEGYGSSSSDEEEEDKEVTTDKRQQPNSVAEADASKLLSDQTGEIEDKETTNATTGNCHEDDDRPQALTNNKTNDHTNSHQDHTKTRICRFFARNGKCRNGDACHFRHEKASLQQDATSNNNMNPHNNGRRQNQQQQRRKKEPPKSLLRSFLANDIQRERTLTLQLLRYIVDHKFFDDTTTEEENAE